MAVLLLVKTSEVLIWVGIAQVVMQSSCQLNWEGPTILKFFYRFYKQKYFYVVFIVAAKSDGSKNSV